jgi:hypothetical protein
MDLRRQDSFRARVSRPTNHEIEVRKANKRIKVYLAGGSRLVLVSRGVVGGLLIVILVVLWWLG